MISFNKSPQVENENTITYNFIRNFKFIVDQFKPDKVFFALEGHPIHRYALYPEYKANRIVKQGSESNSKFYKESKLILDLLEHLPVTILKHKDYEADDVINSIVHNLSDEENIVVTSDTDYYQMLETTNCKIYNATKKAFLEKFDYPYVVHKSLVGDKSDNIRRLVSDKKAEKLLSNPDEFSKFLEDEESSQDFKMNYELIKFKEIPINEISIDQYLLDLEYLLIRFKEYKFDSLLKESYVNSFTEVFAKLLN